MIDLNLTRFLVKKLPDIGITLHSLISKHNLIPDLIRLIIRLNYHISSRQLISNLDQVWCGKKAIISNSTLRRQPQNWFWFILISLNWGQLLEFFKVILHDMNLEQPSMDTINLTWWQMLLFKDTSRKGWLCICR